jgi:U4/U6.U5 tri-snRNP component SNU23
MIDSFFRYQADEASSKTFSGTVVKRNPLKGRDVDLQIEKNVGKTLVISSTAHHSQTGGYYCKVCDCTVKDSISWLDHVNGKKHNRALGMNMRCERATVEAVQARLRTHKPSDRKKTTNDPFDERSALEELDARIDKLREEEEMEKNSKRVEKKQKREEEQAQAKEGLTDGFESMMGFAGFGGKK